MAGSYASRLRISPTSKSTSIALISMVDNIPERARDYLNRLGEVYNDDANVDNLAEASRTADFIDERLGIISKELNTTEAELEQYKRASGITDYAADTRMDAGQQLSYENQIVDVSTQMNLLDYLIDYVNNPSNHLQVIHSEQYDKYTQKRDDALQPLLPRVMFIHLMNLFIHYGHAP